MADQQQPGETFTCARCSQPTFYSDKQIDAALGERRRSFKALTPGDTVKVNLTCPICGNVYNVTLQEEAPPQK